MAFESESESLYAGKPGKFVIYWEDGESIDAIVLRVDGAKRDLVFVTEDYSAPRDDDQDPDGEIRVRFGVPACSTVGGHDVETPPCWEDD